jgi:hypothetical protein
MYINNIHNFILLPSFMLSFFIHIYWSPSLHLDRTDVGSSSSNRACTSNSRGSGGILTWWGHRTNRRIPSAIRFWKIVIEIILYICMNVYDVPLCNMFDQARWKMTLASISIYMTILCNIMVSFICASTCFKYPKKPYFKWLGFRVLAAVAFTV